MNSRVRIRSPCPIQWGQVQLPEWSLIFQDWEQDGWFQHLLELKRGYFYRVDTNEEFLGGGMISLRQDRRWTQWESALSLAAVGDTRITLKGTWNLGERGEGQCSGEDRKIRFPMLIGSGQGTMYGNGRWWLANFHRREQRCQNNGWV